jgi:hypothetical protein
MKDYEKDLAFLFKNIVTGYFWNSFNPKHKVVGRLCDIKIDETINEKLYVDSNGLHWDSFEETK